MTTSSDQLEELSINTIRTLSMDAVQQANSGHPGTPMALAPLAYTLYTRIMRHNPANPDWEDRDRFVLSAGHASMLLYSMLYLTGYPMTLDDLKHFRRVGWPTAGHPERKYSPGIEATTGPLGQGISMSVGLALAERMLAARFNNDGHKVVDHHTFTIASDGDIQEGVASEACSLGGPPRARPPDRLLRRQPDPARQRGRRRDDRGRRRALRGIWLARGRHRRGPLGRAHRERHARGDGGRGPALADHRRVAHRLRQPAAGHAPRRTARRSARRTCARRRSTTAGTRTRTSSCPTRCSRTCARPAQRGAEYEREWKERFDAFREAHPGRGGGVREHPRGHHAGGLRRGPAALRGRRGDGDPQGLERGDPVGRRARSPPGRRCRRSRHLDQHGHRRRRRRPARLLRGAQPALRRARARHGRDRERPDAARLPRLRQHLPDLLGLHARGGQAVGAPEAAGDLGLHARLDRARRGRPDAPADRAARGPARDAAAERCPARPTPTRPRSAGATRCARPTRRRRSR